MLRACVSSVSVAEPALSSASSVHMIRSAHDAQKASRQRSLLTVPTLLAAS